eukprot:3766746-Lingulodinium_polyedra.AAC.1
MARRPGTLMRHAMAAAGSRVLPSPDKTGSPPAPGPAFARRRLPSRRAPRRGAAGTEGGSPRSAA